MVNSQGIIKSISYNAIPKIPRVQTHKNHSGYTNVNIVATRTDSNSAQAVSKYFESNLELTEYVLCMI